ncbi:MAG: fasciclin domain-containing protein [Synechococcaceae cyanobacterium SM2_3_2]|nr:fasciclin domain-containing protein [Synechococcaceae cyanobacterium SM2_3_2]
MRRHQWNALILAVTLGLLGAACGDSGNETVAVSPPTPLPTPAPTPAPLPNIVELAVATPDLSTLVFALQQAGLVDTLSGPGPFTVFAPINSAFEALPPENLNAALLPENVGLLTDVLTYHVVSGAAVFAGDLTNGQQITTVEGSILTVSIQGDSVRLIDGTERVINVIATDIEASNGVVHLIDQVLLPPGLSL